MLDPELRHRILLLAGVEARKFNPDQPRIPRGNPLGGRWVKGIAALARKWHRENRLDDLDDLIERVDSGEVKSFPLGQGLHGDVVIVDHKNGGETVRKRLLDVAGTFGAGSGMTPKRQADAEQLSSLLGRHIEAPVPRVLRTADDEIHMDVIYGEKWSVAQNKPLPNGDPPDASTVADRLAEQIGSNEGIRLGVFDLLTDNWDRKNGENWLIDDDTNTPIGLDHSFTWDDLYNPSDPADAPFGYTLSPFAALFVSTPRPDQLMWSPNGNTPLSWVDNPLTWEDVNWLLERLAELRDDFARLGREDWWEFAMARLRAIAPYASGTEPIFT